MGEIPITREEVKEIFRRLERIEQELGINADKETLKKQARYFAERGSFYTYKGMSERGAKIEVDGDVTHSMILDVEDEFDSWEFQPDEQAFVVRNDGFGI